MHRAIHQQATFVDRQNQILPGHGTGLEKQAANDDDFEEETTVIQWMRKVLVNVIGGSLLLSGMFFLPQFITLVFVGP